MRENRKTVKSYLQSFILTFLLFLIIGFFFTFVFRNSDDTVFRRVFNGEYFGWSDAHCWFMQYPLSYIIVRLYQFFPSICWYDVYHLAMLFTCVFLSFQRILFNVNNLLKRILCSLFFLVFGILVFSPFLSTIQYSVTSGILGVTAIFRFITMGDERKYSICRLIFEYIAVIILFSLSYCTRYQVALMLMPICFLFIIKRFIVVKTDRKATSALICFVVVTLALIGSIFGINTIKFNSQEYKDYKSFLVDRSTIYDYYGYPDYEEYKDFYDEIGVTEEEYNLLKSDYDFLIVDESLDIREVIHAVAEKAKEIEKNSSFEEKIEDALDLLFDDITNKESVLLLLLTFVLIVFAFCFIHYNRFDYLLRIAFLMYIFGLLSYLAYKGRLPQRVFVTPVFSMIAVFLSDFIDNSTEKSISKNAYRGIITVLLGLSIIFSCDFNYLRTKNSNYVKKCEYRTSIAEYCSKNSDNLYLIDTNTLGGSGVALGEPTVTVVNSMGVGGWMYNHPLTNYLIASWNLDNIPKKVLSNDNLYIISASYRTKGVMRRINAYYESIDSNLRVKKYDEIVIDDETTLDVLHFYNKVDIDSEYSGSLESGEKACYQLNCSEACEVKLLSSKDTSKYKISVYDFDGNLLEDTNNFYNLDEGDYKVFVMNVSDESVSYKFSFNKVKSVNVSQDSLYTQKDRLISRMDESWYKINVSESSETVGVTFSKAKMDVTDDRWTVTLYDASGKIDRFTINGQDEEVYKNYLLNKGTYYLKISRAEHFSKKKYVIKISG